ncbi:IS66 family transposase ISPpu19 [Cupriavidus laharis]|uniref:IS66 family transposase ISPpu19 n=2 Tax=Cupriavidus laharis TaxID=151654 RepID=A0ABM8XJ29_9BURK|nr:IS66 family transposase ISPpu19 [Cupriavidus laharis]
MVVVPGGWHDGSMLNLRQLQDQGLQDLAPEDVLALAQQMLAHIQQQEREIKLKDVKIEKITFELARLKAWKFGAKTEAMSAEQRRLFEETLAEDEASLQAQLQQAKGEPSVEDNIRSKRKPRRQPLPAHLRRVEHHHEPEDTHCPTPGCGRTMVRVGEDVSERLDIVPAEFFVHRHIYGKWACRCCQRLVQEPVEPQIIDGGLPAAGLVAHTLISRFVDHLPYYRQETINARSGVHTPRSTLAAWSGRAGAALEPLYEAHKRFVLAARVLHADETPVAMLDPGAGKTKRAYVWAYSRGAFDPLPGVIYDFCTGRSAQYPIAFLGGTSEDGNERCWQGTLVRDEYAAYDSVLQAYPGRKAAGCLAHARRRYDELLRNQGSSTVAPEALRRIAQIYRLERELATLSSEQRLARRHSDTKPLWEQLHAWLQLERSRVPDGSITAKALDYSLKNWPALTQHLLDGEVSVDNNSLENLIRPWALGRKAWLFAGSELAGQRAAVVMSLVQSAKLQGHDPWAYLNDVLTRLPTHLNSRIDELLPHNWRPAR